MRSLWTSTTGMSAQNMNMDVIANNLANVSTSGFKKSRADFQDLLYQIMKVPGSPTSADTKSPTGIQVGLGVKPAAITKVFTEGDIVQTQNTLMWPSCPGILQCCCPRKDRLNPAGNRKRTEMDESPRPTANRSSRKSPSPIEAREITTVKRGVSASSATTPPPRSRQYRSGGFHQRSRAHCHRPQSFPRNRGFGNSRHRHPRIRWTRHPAPGVYRKFKRQSGRGVDPEDHDPTGV